MEEVRRLRLEKGWNQNELAFHADLAPSVISLLETGKREPNATTLRKLAEALEVRIPDLFEDSGSGKAQRRSSPPEPSPFNGDEDERLLRYPRALRALIWNFEKRWENEPPKDSRETSVILDTMQALREQGVFDLNEARGDEWMQLKALLAGLEKLNDIADQVEETEEAERRRAEFTLIQEKIGA